MAYCPNCGYEYEEGIAECPDCKEKLLPKEEVVFSEEWTEENWEVVFTTEQEYIASMVKDNLESAGMKAIILAQKDRNFPGAGDFSIIKLYVRKEDAAHAKEFIENLEEEDSEQ